MYKIVIQENNQRFLAETISILAEGLTHPKAQELLSYKQVMIGLGKVVEGKYFNEDGTFTLKD